MELEIIEIGRRTEVEDAEELILQRHFQTCRKALGHIEMGLIHHAIRGTLVGDVLYHVVRWTIVGTQQQRMFRPRLKIIEREGMGILWGQFGIPNETIVASLVLRKGLSWPPHGRRSLRV